MNVTTRTGQVVSFAAPVDTDGAIRPQHCADWSAAMLAAFRALEGRWLFWDPWRRQVVDSHTGESVPHEVTGGNGIGVVAPGAPGRITRYYRAGGRLVRYTSSDEADENGIRLTES